MRHIHLVASVAFVALALVFMRFGHAQPVIDHNIRVSVDVESGRLHLSDQLQLPSTQQQWIFFLNATLDVTVSDGNATLKFLNAAEDDLRVWQLDVHSAGSVTLSVEGIPALPGDDPAGGHISDLGIYLPPESGWLPNFGGTRATFTLGAALPKGWSLITQGSHITKVKRLGWRELKPQQGIWFVAGPFDRFEVKNADPQLIALLRTPDEALAQRYLKAAQGWIDAYSKVLGPYPYEKFALVENFWETGYAMPSFSLMGSRVLRLPFIVHTAWPHEVLHNWFGNGVYVKGGNWSEGLTAYLADHLVREGSGSGRSFRRDTLQKYRNFVDSSDEFPVAEFRSRHDPATAAIGYDKVLMIFHMLRRELGDDSFRKALAEFYSQWRYRAASWNDLRESMELSTGKSLSAFFNQWTSRKGAPQLALADVREIDGCVTGLLQQTQTQDPWNLRVPIYVTRIGDSIATEHHVAMDQKEQRFSFCADAKALRIDVDPWFDVMRRLSTRETPASIGELLGDEDILAVLPAAAQADEKKRWTNIATALKLETVDDNALEALPSDRSVWLFGKSNRHLAPVIGLEATESNAVLALGEDQVGLSSHAVFVARRNGDRVIGVATVPQGGDPEAFINRLQHYTRYSYLGFAQGDRRASVRGQWPVVNSPLSVIMTDDEAPQLSVTPRAAIITPQQ